MEGPEATEVAAKLMAGFAQRTGLMGERPPQRYLWTDAFAVCNFLELHRLTGEDRYTQLALTLIHQVHHVLGRRRTDDASRGWLSGLAEAEGEAHPTMGGLRIGKKYPERLPGQPFDEQLEWDRDGQYFHYLTKWMHALDQAARAMDEPRFNLWARELAQVAHTAFTFDAPRSGQRRMAWKMSSDLSRPLVPSMGQHDPLDGFVTCIQLEMTASTLSSAVVGPRLKAPITDFASMLGAAEVMTYDPLGLGGLLSEAWRIAQLIPQSRWDGEQLLLGVLGAAQEGLALALQQSHWKQPASHRLAFRELGLAIGLWALERLREAAEPGGNLFANAALRTRIAALAEHLPLRGEIVSFWNRPEHQSTRTWFDHRDINEVMLATGMVPAGYLVLAGRSEVAR